MPIFVVSSVTGLGLPVLHAFLNALPALPHAAAPLLEPTPQGPGTTAQRDASSVVVTSRQQQPGERGLANGHHRADAGTTAISGQQPPDERGPANGHQRADAGSMQHSWQQAAATHFQVDHTFEVKGVGCVVSGTVVSGEVAVHQTLNLGPMGEGGFRQVQVTCIHRSQVKLFCGPTPLAICYLLAVRSHHAVMKLQPCTSKIALQDMHLLQLCASDVTVQPQIANTIQTLITSWQFSQLPCYEVLINVQSIVTSEILIMRQRRWPCALPPYHPRASCCVTGTCEAGEVRAACYSGPAPLQPAPAAVTSHPAVLPTPM